jgi:UDP-N-acetyl-D-mannosaminuronic acid dehydrogenase
MIKLLETECSKVVTHDPYVLGNQKSISNLEQFIDVCDIFILMTLHDEYKNIKTEKPIVDVWNFFGKGFGI